MRLTSRVLNAGMALLFGSIGLSRPSAAQEVHPSFPCSKATMADEQTICSDDRLAELDQAASIAYGQIPKSSRADARQSLIDNLNARHGCGTDKICIMDQQITALQAYDGYGPKVPVPPWVGAYRLSLIDKRGQTLPSRLPTIIGQCGKTRIASISDRFGGEMKEPAEPDNDQGSAVGFANQGYQVSYSYEPAIAHSAIGDGVVLCLVSLPKDCPKGDERGKFYSATNLRTRESWIMADSQHMCGGA